MARTVTVSSAPSSVAPHGAEISAFLMQATCDLFMVCDNSGRVVCINPAWGGTTGWTPADLVGKSILQVVHPEDLACARAAGHRVHAGEQSFKTTWRLTKRDGDAVVVSWNVTIVGDYQYSLGRNVSDFVRTEQAFDLAMRQREILECAAGVGSWTHSQRSGTVGVSRGLAALLCLPQEANEASRAAIEAVSGELWPLFTESHALDVVVKLGPPSAPVRLRLVRAPMQEDGLVCGVAIDETATVTALEAADETRLRMELALDAGRAAAWQLDLDPRRLWVSPKFEALIGRPVSLEEMLTGQGAATHPDDIGLTIACTKRLMEKPTRSAVEHRIVRPNGEIRWVQTLCQTLGSPDGRVNRAVGLTVDVTERRMQHQQLLAATRRAERALAQRRALLGDQAPPTAPVEAGDFEAGDFEGYGELFHHLAIVMGELDHRDSALAASFDALKEARAAAEAASLAKSQFLANMSHELRTPINAIIGFGELIADDAAGRDVQIAEDAGKVVAAAHRLLAMINELLDLARMDAGRLRASPRATDIRGLLDQLAQTHAESAAAKGNRLTLNVSDEVGTVLIDGDRLAQALRHLLNNAIKFTTDGDICLSAKRTGQHAEALLVITVADTGVGMSAQDIAALHAPLTQADGSATRRHGGAGLGLAVARRLAQLLGGELGIASIAGQGATLTVSTPYLPISGADIACAPKTM